MNQTVLANKPVVAAVDHTLKYFIINVKEKRIFCSHLLRIRTILGIQFLVIEDENLSFISDICSELRTVEKSIIEFSEVNEEQFSPLFNFFYCLSMQANHFDHKSIDSASLLVANCPSIYRKRRIEKNIRKQCSSAVSRVSGKIYSNPLSDKTEDVMLVSWLHML
ncbi:hypothetical protein T05_614 [Trichinella murrelli]|uniref:Uncharacterized protein n=1 Tax=Trichinella murrelli TaxID=144512 RepID=A0A0V0UGB2_9BILA|nr:hypothetical protein T05_614 [Trichinella murrelli]